MATPIENNTEGLQEILRIAQELPAASDVKLQEKTVAPSTTSQSVTPDNGYDGLSKVTVGAMPTATQATPSISVSNSGLITASATQTAGYVSAGTKSATQQLTTQSAKTITPSTSSQTAVSSGVYTTGTVTVAAIPNTYVQPTSTKSATTYTPTTSNQTIAAGTYCSGTQTIKGDSNLVAGNIKNGISIFGVNGNYEGVDLNFEVVGGTTQHSNPKENTIWVNTSTTISSWIFSATQPSSPSNGMLWFSIGTNSTTEFNALKNNGIQVYPISAKQYVSGAWERKDAYIYNNDMWNQFSSVRYIILPNTNIAWTEYENNGTVQTATATNNADSTVIKTKHFSKSGGNAGWSGMYSQEFDFTGYNTLHVDGSISWDNSGSANNTIQRIELWEAETKTKICEVFTNSTSGSATGSKAISKDFDISAISKCRIAFTCVTWDGSRYITVTCTITSLYVS